MNIRAPREVGEILLIIFVSEELQFSSFFGFRIRIKMFLDVKQPIVLIQQIVNYGGHSTNI